MLAPENCRVIVGCGSGAYFPSFLARDIRDGRLGVPVNRYTARLLVGDADISIAGLGYRSLMGCRTHNSFHCTAGYVLTVAIAGSVTCPGCWRNATKHVDGAEGWKSPRSPESLQPIQPLTKSLESRLQFLLCFRRYLRCLRKVSEHVGITLFRFGKGQFGVFPVAHAV